MFTISNRFRLPAIALLTVLPACGGGGGGDSGTNPPVAGLDLNGSWTITESITSATGLCSDEQGTQNTFSIAVAQNGNALTVSTPAGQFSGTLSGSTVQWTGSYPEDGGTTTITSMSLSATATSLTGSSNWSWSNGSTTCNGTTTISGSKDGGGGGASSGNLSGTWLVEEMILSASGICAGEVGTTDSYSIDVAQNGSALTVTAPAGTFSGSVNGGQIQWTGSYPEDGGTTTILSMTLTVSGSSLSGTSSWSWSNGIQSCSGTTMIQATRISGLVLGGLGEVSFLVDQETDMELTALFAEPGSRDGSLLGAVEDYASFPLAVGTWDVWVVARKPGSDADPFDLPVAAYFPDVTIRGNENTLLLVELRD